jgi:phytol kinase
VTLLDALKALGLLLAVALLFGLLRVYQVRAKPAPELVRKLFHISGGAVGLVLPWLFDSIAPVLVLAALVAAAFLAMRFVHGLRHGVGQVLFGVERQTIGELCFLVSMCLLFWFARGNKLLYSVPLLMLALADTSAALIGEQYGKRPLHMSGDRKSLEGVTAFFLTAFFCVHVPVLLWGETGRLESLLIGVNSSIMVMMAEAAAWWGMDNLIIPIWGYMVLKSQLGMGVPELGSDLAFLLSLALVMRLWRDRTTLGDDALFGATLWGYVVWAVGGWRWIAAPLIQLLAYATVTYRAPADQLRGFRFPVVLAQIAGSVVWLLIYRESGVQALFYPFVACFGANVAIIALVRHKFAVPDLPWRRALSANVAKGMLVVVPSVLVMDGVTTAGALDIAACLIAVAAATAIFYRMQPGLADFPVDARRWILQSVTVAATSTLALGIHYGAPPSMSPTAVIDLFRTLVHP